MLVSMTLQDGSVPPDADNPISSAACVPEVRPCRVGPFTLSIPAMQAGLAGYSDMAMRCVARRRGCPYAVTEALLESEGESPDHQKALEAQSALALGRWWRNSRNAPEQLKVLNDYTAVVKANPSDPGVVQTLGTMMQLGPANDDVLGKLIDVVKTNMKGAAADSLVTAAEGTREMHAMIGKPFTVAGRTIGGGKFNSDDWRGKVILVDFWATWCVPCVAELPHVKKLYDEQHAKGLEVVGVDCDPDDQPVIAFTKQRQIPWPQVRETSQNDDDQWSPLAKQWHVTQIPTMFLIDRKGVLRYVDALEGTETKVAALLAEPGPATQPAK